MRIVTYLTGNEQRAGLLVDDTRILDVLPAFQSAQKSGLLSSDLQAPASVLDIVCGGEALNAACNSLLDAVRSGGEPFQGVDASTVTLAAPIPKPLKNVFCVGSNYRAHVTEASRAQAKEDKTPKLPVFFTKPPTAVVGPDAPVHLDPDVSEKMD